MTEESNLMHEGSSIPKQSPSKGQRSSRSVGGTMAREDTAIAVLSSGLKRPVMSDEANDQDAHVSKKQCIEVEQKHDDKEIEITQGANSNIKTPLKEGEEGTMKTSPGKPPKYRASSPTIMTTRGKRQKSDFTKETVATAASLDKREESSSMISTTAASDRGDGPRSKKNAASCVVPGCHVTSCGNSSGIKWYKIPKEDNLRQIWLNKIGRPGLDPEEHHRVCSNHFAGGRKTFDNTIPTIGVPTSSVREDGSDLSSVSASQGKASVTSNKNSFLSNKPWYSRWSITGNTSGSMCCIPGCKSTRRRNLALKYYRFPKEEKLRRHWLASIGVRNFMPRDNSRVCSTHFEGCARSDKNSIPTIFSPDTAALQNMKVLGVQQVFKQEPVESIGEEVPNEQFFHRQISPRKQAVPQRFTKAGPKVYGNYCCVAGCNSKYVNNQKLSFYRIPRKSKPELRQQWIDAIGAHNITSSEARVCSLHFEGGRKSETSRVPTILPKVTAKSPAKHRMKQKLASQDLTATGKWKKCLSMPTPQSNIETLLQASDILSRREAESRSSTPPSSSLGSPMKDQSMETSHLLPETPRGSSCMVPGCNNTRSNSKGRLRWYRVPKHEIQRKLWLNAIGWPNAVPTDTTRICSDHFIEGIYRKKGDKAVPTIFPPKPKDWQERHPQYVQDKVKVEPNQDMIPCTAPLSPSHSISPNVTPSSPRGGSPRGDQKHGVLSFVTRNHFRGHPYGPTMLRPEVFERSPKQQASGESRGVTCCIARCHNNTKRTPGLRWYRIPADPMVRQQWINFIRVTRPEFTPKNHHRVCSAHFEGGMKFSKSSIPTIYDKPLNRRFLPPSDYQQPLTPDGGPQQQVAKDADWHHQQQQMHELQQQQANMQDIPREALQHQTPKMEVESETGSGSETSENVDRVVRTPNSNSPIRERCIPPLTYRENPGLVYLDNQDVEVSHEVSVPYNAQFEQSTRKAATENLALEGASPTLEGTSPNNMMEPKKRAGGGGQCFVPGCTNTRRHNPGLKWYRIPKDIDLRILWLDNIGCPDADPKPHNRVCSDHFEGGYKQFNTSLPTVEKWSDTSKHVYTGKPVVDTKSSIMGSTLLAVDNNPIAVDASSPRVTPSAAEMQSLADSLTALAAELGVVGSSSANSSLPGGVTPPMSFGLDQSATSHSMTLNSDNLSACLVVPTSRSRSTSRSSSVATYASSFEEDGVANLADVANLVDVDSKAVDGATENEGGTKQNIMRNAVCHLSTQSVGVADDTNKDSTHQKLCDPEGSVKTVSLEDKLPVKPPIFEESGGKESEAKEDGNDIYHFDKKTHMAKQEKMNPEERIQYLEGLVQSMCEELRFKEQKLQEKECNLASCMQKLQEKDSECERIKRKCLMMSVRLGSFRKLAQTDL